MAKSEKDRKNNAWLKSLGKKIEKVIHDKGYRSPYEFWVERVGDEISRSGLNFILTGQRDPRITTLKLIANALDVQIEDLLPRSEKI